MDDACLISDVECDSSSIRPIILNFENGTLRTGQEAELNCRLYKDNADKLLVAATTKKLLYSGHVNQDDLYSNFIGIYSKKKNKVKIRLIAVDYATLSPFLQIPEDIIDTSINENKSRSTADLNKEFGSKRAKRQTEQRERMQLDIENVREHLEQTVSDIKIDPQEIAGSAAVSENDSEYRPPINRNATNVKDVYDVDKIVSSTILESMSDEVDRVLASEEENFGCSAFVTQEIKRLQRSTSNEKKRNCQILLYVDCLIKFTVATAKVVVTKKFQSCPYSEAVTKDILLKFTVQSKQGRLRPNTMKDKCLCYILVMSMTACNYQLQLDVIAREVKMGLKKLQEVSRVLAFSVSKDVAVLKLPLPAPISLGAKKTKKRN